jgi:hypothetical protein
MAAVATNPGVVRIRESISKVKTASKAKGEKGKGANAAARTTGGDVLPTPEPMADSPMDARGEEPAAEGGPAAVTGA